MKSMKATLAECLLALKQDDSRGIHFIDQAQDISFVSYKDIYNKAQKTLSYLQKAGLRQGSELVIQAENNIDFLITFWACLLGGIIAIPVTNASQDEYKLKLIRIWTSLKSPFLVIGSISYEKLKAFCLRNAYHDELKSFEGKQLTFGEAEDCQGENHAMEITPATVAYIQYSSGSTGDPKGVILTHDNLMANVYDIASCSAINSTDILLSWMPLTHDMGLICFHLTGLLCGVNQYLMSTTLFVRRPLAWMDLASRHRATVIYSPNFGYQYFLSASNDKVTVWDLSSIRLIYNGAEIISRDIISTFLEALLPYGLNPASMYPGYGLAEAAVAVSLQTPGEGLKTCRVDRRLLNVGDRVKEVDASQESIIFTTLGRPLPSCSIRFCDDQGQLLDDRCIGNLQIKGRNVTEGYYRNPKKTEEVFTHDGWLKTGDVGFFRNGEVVLTGRKKNIIIIAGQNYYPHDIESIVQSVLGWEFGRIVACGIKSADEKNELLVIFLQFKGNIEKFVPVSLCVKDTILQQLGIAAEAVLPLTKIPKTTSGKIQYFRLAGDFEKGLFSSTISTLYALEAIYSRDNMAGDIAGQLIKLLKNFVGEEVTSGDQIFLNYGLSSLAAIRFLNRVNTMFDLDLTLKDLFENDTISALAGIIKSRPRKVYEILQSEKASLKMPLTPTQARFLALEATRGDGAPLNITASYTINGSPNTEVIQQSLAMIVRKFDVLRSVINISADEVTQTNLSCEELGRYFFIEKMSLDDYLASRDSLMNQPFNLSEGPLFRIFLVFHDASFCSLLLTFHHIIADGWSLQIFMKDFATLYNSLLSQQNCSYPPLTHQFSECMAIRRQIDSEQILKAKAYWEKQFDADVDFFNSSKPAWIVSTGSNKSQRAVFSFDDHIYERLMKLTVRFEVTLFVLLFSLTNILLYRMTGRKKLVVGTDFSGRDHSSFEEQIGCFIQTLLLHTQIEECDDFHSFVTKLKSLVADAIAHKSYTVEDMIEHHRGTTASNGYPLFDVLLLFDNFDTQLQLDGLQVKQDKITSLTSFADLQFEFELRDNVLNLHLTYNPEAFDGGFINQIEAVFLSIIDFLHTHSNEPLTLSSYLAGHDYSQVLAFSSGEEVDCPGITFTEMFEKAVTIYPQEVALLSKGVNWSYQQLNDAANRMAHMLIDRYKLMENDCVGLILERSAFAVMTMIAVGKAGAVCVPIDPAYPPQRRKLIFSQVSPVLLIVQGQIAEIPQEIDVLHEDTIGDLLHLFSTDNLNIKLSPTSLSHILFTSGTTGSPKGVPINHNALANYIHAFTSIFLINNNDVVIQSASLAFDISFEEIFPVLTKGGKLVIHPEGSKDIEGLLSLMREQNVSILTTTPLVLYELNNVEGDLESLRLIISGGERLKIKSINRLVSKYRLFNTYGPTEATVSCTYYEVSGSESNIPIGKPMINKSVYVLDSNMKLQPIGWLGEVYVGGRGITGQYWKDPELTKRRFFPSPFRNGEILYKTGDIARWRTDGNLEFIGRSDEQVKIHGYRIELADVEHYLSKYAQVKEAAVQVYYVKPERPLLVAYYTSSSEIAESELRNFLADVLPPYMLPSQFIYLNRLPLTSHGKLDKASLPVPQLSKEKLHLASLMSISEIGMLNIWKEVFNDLNITITDGFYELGGNSIKAFQIKALVQKRLALDFELRLLFAGVSISQLVSSMKPRTSGLDIQAADVKDYYHTTIAQQNLWMLDQIESKTKSNLHWSYRIDGSLNSAAMMNVFSFLFKRHESFRTRFTFFDQCLYQQIDNDSIESIHFDDLSGFGNALIKAEEIAKSEANFEFDLKQGNLARFRLLRINESCYIIIITIHHIIADAWSIEILMNEITALYNAYNLKESIDLEPLSLTYKDFAEWEFARRNHKERQEIDESEQKISEAAKVKFGIPTDYPQPKSRHAENNSSLFNLDLTTWQTEIRAFCRQFKLTETTLLLTSLYTFLFQKYKHTDWCIGLMYNRRSFPSLRKLVGFFVTVEPISVFIDTSVSFLTLIDVVKDAEQTVFNSLESHVGNKLQSGVKIVVSDQIDVDNKLNSIPGLHFSEFTPKSDWRNDFDLTFALGSNESLGTHLNILYRSDLFKVDNIAELAQSLIKTMLSSIRDPEHCLVSNQPSIEFNAYSNQGRFSFPSRSSIFEESTLLASFPLQPDSLLLKNSVSSGNELLVSRGWLAILFGLAIARYNFTDEVLIGVSCKQMNSGEDFVSSTYDKPTPLSVSSTSIFNNGELVDNIERTIGFHERQLKSNSRQSILNDTPLESAFEFILLLEDELFDGNLKGEGTTDLNYVKALIDKHKPRLLIKIYRKSEYFFIDYFGYAHNNKSAINAFHHSLHHLAKALLTGEMPPLSEDELTLLLTADNTQ